MSNKPIFQLVDELPESNITIYVLRSLDFVVPGQWENTIGFVNTIRKVTGETDDGLIQQIGDRAVHLFNDKAQGYQRALWLYQTVDRTDSALAAAALANKVGQKVSFLGFLNRITPQADKAQTIDLCVKLVAEIAAFCSINGIPGDSVGDFVKSLVEEYRGPSLMRMAALVCIDALIPLGADFIQKAQSTLAGLSPKELEQNKTFQQINADIPGNNPQKQLNFIGESFDSVKGWMGDFVTSRNLTPEKVVQNLQQYVEIADDRLDYLAAFLDMSTNYFEHTGTQTIARQLIERAVAEI